MLPSKLPNHDPSGHNSYLWMGLYVHRLVVRLHSALFSLPGLQISSILITSFCNIMPTAQMLIETHMLRNLVLFFRKYQHEKHYNWSEKVGTTIVLFSWTSWSLRGKSLVQSFSLVKLMWQGVFYCPIHPGRAHGLSCLFTPFIGTELWRWKENRANDHAYSIVRLTQDVPPLSIHAIWRNWT